MSLDAEWHKSHRMPERASLDQRLKWQLTVLRELARRGLMEPKARRRDAPRQ